MTHHYQLLDVYNIEVEEDHSYIANGFVVHNCRSCLAMHGTMHPLDEPGPLDHHQGRCSRVPVTKTWKELGIDAPEPGGAVKPGDGEKWLNSQPESVQREILGNRGYDAWKRGDWPSSDWAVRRESSGWRDSYGPAPQPQAA